MIRFSIFRMYALLYTRTERVRAYAPPHDRDARAVGWSHQCECPAECPIRDPHTHACTATGTGTLWCDSDVSPQASGCGVG